MTTPSLNPLLNLTDALMEAVNSIIIERMQSEIDLIPTLAGHLVSSGGKRLRPVLTLAGALAASGKASGNTGGADERAVQLAAAVEFIHTATLLHDDVIDASTMRRGQQTANTIWGNEASVLVGDFLFARAFELMVEAGNMAVLGRLASASARITEGEISQMLIAGKPDTEWEDYLAVIIGKTAELFAAAAEAGVMVMGGAPALAQMMRDYGMALGIAFQITDDALDYRGETAETGKMAGDDFTEGKITLPLMLAYAAGNGAERAFWQRTIGRGEITDGDWGEALRLIGRHGGVEQALNEARRHAEAAADMLKQPPPGLNAGLHPPLRDALIEAALFAAYRTA